MLNIESRIPLGGGVSLDLNNLQLQLLESCLIDWLIDWLQKVFVVANDHPPLHSTFFWTSRGVGPSCDGRCSNDKLPQHRVLMDCRWCGPSPNSLYWTDELHMYIADHILPIFVRLKECLPFKSKKEYQRFNVKARPIDWYYFLPTLVFARKYRYL
jgi:hypothetical protein